MKQIISSLGNKVKNLKMYIIWQHFKDDIMNGYNHYAALIEKYGYNTQIYKPSGGTGDVYVVCLHFNDYLAVHNVKRIPVFLVLRDGGLATAKLFGIENIEQLCYADRRSMTHLGVFCGFENIHFTVMNHHPNSLYTSIGQELEVVHNMGFLGVLKNTIFEGVQPTGIPEFPDDQQFMESYFKENNLKIRKTVVLFPYAVSVEKIQEQFWEQLVLVLREQGYTICTNSQGENEPPIKGTVGVNMPIKYMVPFLNMAGTLIGVRSGILDVSETASVKRIIFYPKLKGSSGRFGKNSYIHFSFNAWYEREDAFEIEYEQRFEKQYLEEIGDYLKTDQGD